MQPWDLAHRISTDSLGDVSGGVSPAEADLLPPISSARQDQDTEERKCDARIREEAERLCRLKQQQALRRAVQTFAELPAEAQQERVAAELAAFPTGVYKLHGDVMFPSMNEWYFNASRVAPALSEQYVADLIESLRHSEVVSSLSIARLAPFTARSMCALCFVGLNRPCCNITSLSIIQCKLGTAELSFLCQWLLTRSVRSSLALDLSHNSITGVGLACLSFAMRNASVSSLSLHGNPLGDDAIAPLTDILMDHALSNLDIGFTGISNEGCQRLFVEVPNASGLRTLGLDGLQLSTSSALHLLRCVLRSPSLTAVSLRYSPSCASKAFRERLGAVFVRNQRRRMELGQPGACRASESSQDQQDMLTQDDTLDAACSTFAGLGNTLTLEMSTNVPRMEHPKPPLRVASTAERPGSPRFPRNGALSRGYHAYTTNEPTRAVWLSLLNGREETESTTTGTQHAAASTIV